MRGPGHLPEPEVRAVRVGRAAAAAELGRDADRLRRRVRAPRPAAVVVDHAVDDAVQRVDRVVVGGQPPGGLRLAVGDHALDGEARQRAVAQRLHRLREHVPAEDVAARVQRAARRIGIRRGQGKAAVARRAPALQAVDADELRGQAHGRVAVAHQVFVRGRPVEVDVLAGRDVVPLDRQRPVELRGLSGAPDDHARRVRVAAVDELRVAQRIDDPVAVGGAGDVVLLLDVAVRREVVGGGGERGRPGTSTLVSVAGGTAAAAAAGNARAIRVASSARMGQLTFVRAAAARMASASWGRMKPRAVASATEAAVRSRQDVPWVCSSPGAGSSRTKCEKILSAHGQ